MRALSLFILPPIEPPQLKTGLDENQVQDAIVTQPLFQKAFIEKCFEARTQLTTATIPTYRGTITDRNNNITAFVMYGELQCGNLLEGHLVRLQGETIGATGAPGNRRGTLFALSGYDFDMNTPITTTCRNPWPGILRFLLLLLGGAVAASLFILLTGG